MYAASKSTKIHLNSEEDSTLWSAKTFLMYTECEIISKNKISVLIY